MKKLFPVLLAVSILLSLTSCSFHSSMSVAEARPVSAAVLPEVSPAPSVAPSSPAPSPVPELSEPPAPSAAPAQNVFHAETHFPAPAESPAENASHGETNFPAPAAPEHVHTWAPVTETIHHEAVTEQVKVIDQPGAEGHFEGGTYPVVVCRCGLEFRTAESYYAHSEAEGEGHGGFTSSVRSNQVWVEGTPEVSHYETRVISEAWDEEVVTGEVCTSCGAVR